MKLLVKLIIVSTLLLVSKVSAQDFQGEATYKSKRKIDIKLDSTQIASGAAEQMMEMLKKQFERTYILKFNKEESIYKEDEAISPPQPSGMQVVMVTSGGSDVLYKNLKEKRYTNQNESFSKLFLIKDDLQDVAWTLESETKNIGDYTCFKATTTREVEIVESGISINGDKDLSTADKAPKMKEITITAWYTPQIPVSAGPGNYHGLPGLILEVNDGSETVICSKIVINPKNASSIVEPDKGKELTQEAYDKIMEKKLKEMEERFRSNDRNRDGESFEIRIGG
ncbi:GLPGLI family protein [Psychroserpens sp. SPM9]|uniref:GLPGLI family protein n=1 Tax=Psychroserpens sp. SPM9 TaxID=2975598 RepID=UPI0021A2A775|nr:GLPGLI family protein [Psychroserpens sp. SPM9]MDG5490023.1 GLPGLI family protein [Psychroserpens sp. SPM9]